MDTPTRERLEELENNLARMQAAITSLEAEVKELRQLAGAVSSGPSFKETVAPIRTVIHESTTAGESWK